MATDLADDRFGPRRSDPSHASAARIYDYWLGGTYNYPIDRTAAEQIIKHMPKAAVLARFNRMWVQRVVRHLVADCGIRQFLDIGSGIPTFGNVHEVAQEIAPTTRVVYVDYERVAVDIGLEILEDNPYATSLHADMRQPETVLQNPATTSMLDFDQPIAMIWGSMLHFIEDRDDPFGIFGRYKDQLKPGGYVALSHLTWQFIGASTTDRLQNSGLSSYNTRVAENITARNLDSIMRFFEGTDLLDPGLVPLPDWKPDAPDNDADDTDEGRRTVICGVGRLV